MSVFDQNNNATNVNVSVNDLVGEGKKFKTVDDLARGKAEADAFIAKIQSEAEELRRQLAASKSVEDQIKAMQQAGSQTSTNTEQQSATTPKALDEAAIDEMLARKLAERESTNSAKQNRDKVDAAILTAYNGDVAKAREAVAAVESTYGIKVAELASTSPAAALRVLGLDQANRGGYATEQSTRTSTQAQAFGTIAEPIRNKAYYDKIKQDMGAAKFIMDRRVQLQMHKDALAQGDAFYK